MHLSERSPGSLDRAASVVAVLLVGSSGRGDEATAQALERASERLSVTRVADPAAAVDRLRERSFDCVVCLEPVVVDHDPTVLESIRAEHPRLPVVLRAEDEAAECALASGASEVVRDEDPPAVLANRIERAVDAAHATDWRAVVDAAGDGVVVHATDDDRILEVNERFCELVGYPRERLLEMTVGDVSADGYHSTDAAAHIHQATTQGSATFEWTIATHDGDRLPVEVTLSLVEGDEGDHVVAVVRDISERKARERTFQAIFDNTFQFTGLLEPDGTLIEANEAALEFGGFDLETVAGEPFWETPLWDGDEAGRDRLREAIDRAAAGEFVRYDAEVQGADRTAVVDFSLKPVFDDDGEVELLIPEGRDVTDLREAERGLADSEERYRTLVENVRDVVFQTDAWGNWTYLNDAWETVTGIEVEAALGEAAFEFIHPEDRERNRRRFEPLVDGQQETTRHAVRLRDGRQHVEVFAQAVREDGQFVGTVGSLRDVTERYEYERELEHQNEELKAAYERIDEGYYAVDSNWRVTYWNDRMVERTGRSSDEVVGEVLWDAYPSLVGTEFDIYFREAMISQRSVSFETHLSDEEMWVEVRVYPAEEGLSVYSSDVTERLESEQELSRTRDLLDKAQEMATLGGWEYDLRTGESRLTEQTRTMFDLSEDAEVDVADESVLEFFHEDDREQLREAFVAAVEESRPFDLELRLAETDETGRPRWVREICEPTSMGAGTVLLRGIVQDVTDRHRYEEQLRNRETALRQQNERLEEFAAIVSHDLRNPMSVMAGGLDLARESGDLADLDRVERALDRMERLVDDLLSLAQQGQQVDETMPVSLERLSERAWEFVDTDGATLVHDGTTTLRADPSRLSQALENLFRNSVEHGSTDDRDGPLTVRVGVLERDGFYVEDDGPGIPADAREAVFEYGYSGSAEGTGLGLSIVRSIVEAHGWSVRATEAESGGARFEVTGVESV